MVLIAQPNDHLLLQGIGIEGSPTGRQARARKRKISTLSVYNMGSCWNDNPSSLLFDCCVVLSFSSSVSFLSCLPLPTPPHSRCWLIAILCSSQNCFPSCSSPCVSCSSSSTNRWLIDQTNFAQRAGNCLPDRSCNWTWM